jgi:hypothetical protein
MKGANKVNYQSLEDFLATERWKAADQETARLMCQVADRVKEGWLTIKDIDNFPHEDLSTIDKLWLQYSHGHFGFSVQKDIYHSLVGTKEYNEKVWEAFG